MTKLDDLKDSVRFNSYCMLKIDYALICLQYHLTRKESESLLYSSYQAEKSKFKKDIDEMETLGRKILEKIIKKISSKGVPDGTEKRE